MDFRYIEKLPLIFFDNDGRNASVLVNKQTASVTVSSTATLLPSPDNITKLLVRAGGKHSVAWKRTIYCESELCRGVVTVSFWKHPPWQAMHFVQRSTHFSKT